MRRVIVIGGLLLLGLAFAKSFGAMDRDHRERQAWTWRGGVPADGWLHVRNRSGSVKIEQGTSDSIEIVASRSWTGRRPQDVAFITNQVGDDIYVCALYGGGDSSDCDEDTYRNTSTNWIRRRVMRIRPVTIGFTIRAPATARINAETRDGQIAVDAPLSALVAKSRNGSIKTEQPIGTIEANTRNGSISAIIADGALAGDVLLETYNGSVTAELPASANANVSLQTRNGRISTDFPLQVTLDGEQNGSRLRNITSVLGTGGPQVKLQTYNGSVRLKSRGEVGSASGGTGAGATASGTAGAHPVSDSAGHEQGHPD